MNIALLGYGKMGKSIEEIAISRNHTISLKTNSDTNHIDFKNTDVAIDFSIPNTAVKNIKTAIDAGIPVISGTTGWLEHYNEVKTYTNENNGAFLYASNFSLGVNIFFEINAKLAQLMSGFKDDYKLDIEEIHHTEKLDAPSGTAISIANQIIENTSYNDWKLDTEAQNTIPIKAVREPEVPGTHTVTYNSNIDELVIKAVREPEIPGTHTVTYNSNIDELVIKHTAHNRKGFALGAVIAAEWIKNKKGVFTMKDVLNIG